MATVSKLEIFAISSNLSKTVQGKVRSRDYEIEVLIGEEALASSDYKAIPGLSLLGKAVKTE